MARKMAHRVALELLRKITNYTRDLIKSTDSRVWSAGHDGGVHPNDSLNYWCQVKDVADLAILRGETLKMVAEARIRALTEPHLYGQCGCRIEVWNGKPLVMHDSWGRCMTQLLDTK